MINLRVQSSANSYQPKQLSLGLRIIYIIIAIAVYIVGYQTIDPQTSFAADEASELSASRTLVSTESTLMSTGATVPFIYVTPSQDGTTLYIETEDMEKIGGELFANTSLMNGGTHYIGGWTGTYSSTARAYIMTIVGFSPDFDIDGTVNLTSTTGINSGDDVINRVSVDTSEVANVVASKNGQFELILNASETLPFDANIVVNTHQSGGLPDVLPEDYTLIGYAYTALASGSILESDKPMTLRLYYTPEMLAGHDPATVTIMAWNANSKTWEDRGGILRENEQYISTETHDFTAYALVSKPVETDKWHDDFISFSNVDWSIYENLTLGRDTADSNDFILTLIPGSTNGYLATKPIALPEEATGWDRLAFVGSDNLDVDVLDVDGNVLLGNVTSGASLTSIDHTTHPSIRLKITMTSENQFLDSWQVSWTLAEECIEGDINCDGTVNISDFGLLRAAFSACAGDTNYNADADLNNDGCVNISDFGILRKNFGQQE